MKNIYDWMIKREGVLREKHAARRFSENHKGGRERSGEQAWLHCTGTQRDTWNPSAYVRNNVKLKHLALASKIKEDKKRGMLLC